MSHGHSTGADKPPTAAEADRASFHAALTLALTLPGDTLLYLLLPLYAASFGVSLPEAGLLLAANRLVRIAGYGWVGRYYAAHGARAATVLGACGALVATLSYATLSGVWALLVGRLIWGLSYAAMNIANQALPTSTAEGAAKRSGRSRAIIAMGPTVGLLGGAVLAQTFGPRSVFLVLAAIAAVAPFVAAGIPKRREVLLAGGPRFERPGALSLWSFAIGFTMDGLLMFGLGLLAAASYPRGAVLAAGVAMALRYAVEVGFSPVGGHLAHRFGARRTLVTASLGAALGLGLLSADGWLLWVAVVATIVLRALTGPIAAPLVAEEFPGPERVRALARQATWRDIGAGTGPLAAGFLFQVASPLAIYGSAAVLLAVTSLMLLGMPGARAAASGDTSPRGKPSS
ncbi:MAG: MFS transporter [Hyphomicrobiaceae bacterium]